MRLDTKDATGELDRSRIYSYVYIYKHTATAVESWDEVFALAIDAKSPFHLTRQKWNPLNYKLSHNRNANVQLPHNANDDSGFIALIGSFISTYSTSLSAKRIVLIHVDNWFGERWLGFAGKFKGIAGIRQRRGKLGVDGDRSLATPPFRPSRIQSYAGYSLDSDGSLASIPITPLHYEKNGGFVQTLIRNGLYAWYSGNTAHNTTGCLMLYELNSGGEDAWYIQFAPDPVGKWNVVSCRNTQIADCRAISEKHYQQMG